MTSAPFPVNESERLRELLDYHVLDTDSEKVLDDLVELAARACDVPISLVSLIDRDRQWFKARYGLEATETPRDVAFCAHAILDDETFVVEDATEDERFSENPLVTGPPDIRFYAGVPLKSASGHNLGTLCVIDRKPRSLTEDQKSVLEVLARQVMVHLELKRRIVELERTREQRDRAEKVLRERSGPIDLTAAQAELAHSAPMPGEVIDQLTDAILVVGSGDVIESANQPAERLFGWRISELLGRDMRELVPAFDPRQFREDPVDMKAVRADGASFIAEVSSTRVEHEGRYFSLVVLRDVTERRRIEEETQVLQSLLIEMAQAENLNDAFILALRELCRLGEWTYGEVWLYNDGLLAPGPSWTHDEEVAEVLAGARNGMELTQGEGLAGIVLDTGLPLWVDRLPTDERFTRKDLAARLGLETAYAVPVVADENVAAVLVFFSRHAAVEDPRETSLVASIASQLGTLIQKKIAEDELAESEDRYRDLFENATDLIQSVDPEGRFIFVNRSWRETLGYTSEEVASLTLFDVVAPDEHDHCREIFGAIRKGGGVKKVETVFLTKGGDRRVVEGNLSTRRENGEVVSNRGIFRDVTKRKKAEHELLQSHQDLAVSESRLRSMFESVIGGLVVFDEDGRVGSINPSGAQITGYGQDELVGMSFDRLLPEQPNDSDELRRNALEDSLGRVTEWEIKRKDGEIIPIEVSLFRFDTSEGPRVAGFFQDVSERREVERMKKEFVSTVSHELRTPLTSIRGSLDLVAGGVLGEVPEKVQNVIRIAQRNSIRLIGLINDILDLERLDSGRMEMTFEPTLMSDLIQSSVESVQSFSAEKRVEIQVATAEGRAIADRDRISQVLINLLSNAIKFSEPETKVIVESTISDGEVEVSVTDQGRGIPEEFIDHIFGRFRQVESSDARSKGGSGLGLAICKAIIEQHQGAIGVESEEGSGSRFWFRLPVASTHGAGRTRIACYTRSNELRTAIEELAREIEGEAVFCESLEDPDCGLGRLDHLALVVDIDLDGSARLIEQLRDTYPNRRIILVRGSSVEAGMGEENEFVLAERTAESIAEAVRLVGAARPSVLVVEDDEGLLQILREQLESAGVKVVTAETGTRAIELIDEFRPSLLVLDIGLPDLDGFEIVSHVKGDPELASMPLLVYSGLDLSLADRRALQLGPTQFLQKGAGTYDDFRKIVNQLIQEQEPEA